MTRHFGMLALSLAMMAAVPSCRAQDPAPAGSDSWDARLVDLKGDVKVYTAGQDKPLPAKKDLPLEEGDRLVTGKESTVDIGVDGRTLVHISALSDFTLTNINRKQTSYKLSLGTFLGKIQKLLAGQTFAVETPNAVAAVRGTEFGVELDAAKAGDSYVGVFDEGKVEVKGHAGNSETIIAGQETKVAKGQAPVQGYQLQRFMKYRSYMRVTMKKHIQELAKNWKTLTPEERKAAREKVLAEMRELRDELEKRAAERKQGRQTSHETEQGREQKEKMERLKEQIRERESNKK
jgi:hypothetical protein